MAAIPQFDSPNAYAPSADRPKMSALTNALIILECTGETRDVEFIDPETGAPSNREAAVVNLTAVDGLFGGQRFDSMFIFQTGIKAAIAGKPVGTLVLGRLTKPGPAYVLSAPTEQDKIAAAGVLSAAAPPF